MAVHLFKPNRFRSAFAALGVLATLSLGVGSAQAATCMTAFEWNEGGPGNGRLLSQTSPSTPPILESHHTGGGPVLADDFIPIKTGPVCGVTWWGSATQNNNWELTFHTNNAANDPSNPYVAQHNPVVAAGSDPDGDGVFKFTAAWNPMDMFVSTGSQYWFSVANYSAGWEWALAGPGGPQIGGQTEFALGSVGMSPGGSPHVGPWSLPNSPSGATVSTNLAFKISVVPLPAALPMLLAALGGLAAVGRRKRRAQA